MGVISDLKEKLKASESEETSQRFQQVESFLSKNAIGGSFSWGLLLLSAFGIYAVVNLVIVIFSLF